MNIFFSKSLRLSFHVPPKCGTHMVLKSIAYCELNNSGIEGNKANETLFRAYAKYPADWKKYERVILVRNPFSRALSMFSNKAHRVHVQFKNKKQLTYHDFKFFLKHAGRCKDHHIKPIALQAQRIWQYNNIFYLEDLDSFYSFLKDRATTGEQYRNLEKLHSDNTFMNTSSSYEKYRGYLTLEAIDKIIDIYSSDFELLKYSKNKEDIFKAPKL